MPGFATCVPANSDISPHFASGKKVLRISEILTREFESLWNVLRSAMGDCNQATEKAGVVDAVVRCPIIALCLPIAAFLLLFAGVEPRVIWGSSGFFAVALANLIVRLVRWPEKVTLERLVAPQPLLARPATPSHVLGR